MKTRILMVLTIITCAVLLGSSALATKLAVPAQTKPDADLATPASELAKPSVDLTRPTADLTKPTVDVTKPEQDRIKPEFQRPMRELMPMPISNRTGGPRRAVDNDKPVNLKQK